MQNVQQKFGEVLSSALSSAFGIAPPCTLTEEEKHSVFNGQPDIAELCKRLREKRYQKIIVMAGAGISVSAGIPDFRSPGTGLYDTLDLEKYQLPSAQALFDISFFRENPKPFYKIRAKGFFSQPYQPTPTHHFIKLLANKQLLHRCYTQVSYYIKFSIYYVHVWQARHTLALYTLVANVCLNLIVNKN